eukprot:gnl/TRDRNA2_/TRDRNA2_175587_c2_seq1.p1 gnl/TRDRNA2_/TRDRNA2_175587_c2~~gnl/TRDRNA2_/TRDRNA2_175587_c2_seq1.p1  ORF type:complete len:188 (-),score=12.31 gnl/TRDRNA2_/TRDRNA2_175587_c2_seq1:126-689(-)
MHGAPSQHPTGIAMRIIAAASFFVFLGQAGASAANELSHAESPAEVACTKKPDGSACVVPHEGNQFAGFCQKKYAHTECVPTYNKSAAYLMKRAACEGKLSFEACKLIVPPGMSNPCPEWLRDMPAGSTPGELCFGICQGIFGGGMHCDLGAEQLLEHGLKVVGGLAITAVLTSLPLAVFFRKGRRP